MKQEKRKWGWQGLNKDSVMDRLFRAKAKIINYKTDLVVGFPGTTPHSVAIKAFKMFLSCHPNNICTHTSEESEIGFLGTQELERETIFMMAELLGVKNNAVHGYISSGGTESNIMGILAAREYLEEKIFSDKGCCVITFEKQLGFLAYQMIVG